MLCKLNFSGVGPGLEVTSNRDGDARRARFSAGLGLRPRPRGGDDPIPAEAFSKKAHAPAESQLPKNLLGNAAGNVMLSATKVKHEAFGERSAEARNWPC
jgi:hypothetical protein